LCSVGPVDLGAPSPTKQTDGGHFLGRADQTAWDAEGMSDQALILLAIVVIGNTAGQLCLKGASVRAERAGVDNHWPVLLRDPVLWAGLATYVFEFFVWLAFISLVPLWQGVMVACIDILLVMVGGRIFFGEHITPPRLGAISLIAVGVLMVGLGGN
jgi:drug/metabolite transporter (DMT)-like permease